MALKLKPLRKTKTEIIPPPKVGEIVEGKLIAIDKNSVYLDLGVKGIGVIYGIEYYRAKSLLKNIKIGEKVSAKIIELENDDGYRELSVVDASKDIAWNELKKAREERKIIEVKIKKVNKGGLISDISGIAAFLPVSQLSPKNYPKVENGDVSKIVKALQKFIGEKMQVRIIGVEQKKDKLIISEKAAEEKKATDELLNKYSIGEIVDGEVSGITNFGAFIRIGDGVEGLLYPSEIEGSKKIEDVLRVGQKIKAKIIKIADNQIFLSLKI